MGLLQTPLGCPHKAILVAADSGWWSLGYAATAPADELSIEDLLAVEHDVIPLDGVDVFQQREREIDSIGDRSHWLRTREISHAYQ